MNFKHYLYPLLFLVVSNCLDAQVASTQSYRNNLTLSFGLNHGYFKDQNFSPLNYRSPGTRFSLAYTRSTAAGHQWSTELGGSLNTLKNPVNSSIDPDRYLVDIAFGYLRALNGNHQRRNLYLGGKYRSYVDLTLFDGAEAVTFFALHAFEIAGAGTWRAGERNRLKASASTPVFGLLSRPPYTGWDKFIADDPENIPRIITRGDWLTLGAFTGLRANLGWEHQISNRWAIEARYSLAYYATKRLDPFRSLDNSFGLNLTYR